MTIKVLIVDPEISFAVPIKRALELSGDFRVNVFASGKAASEALFRERHDIAVLDFNIADLKLPDLINTLRRTQPELSILVSPSSDEHMGLLSTLDVQGNLTKPYLARQLLQVIQEIVGTAQPTQAQPEPQPQPADPVSTPEPAPETKPEPVEPPPSIAASLEATLAADEPAMRPDDTFVRLIALFSSSETDKNKPIVLPPDALNGILEPEIPEGATIRELVTGNTPPSHMQPVQPPEQEPADADTPPPLAVLALEAAENDTIPLQRIAPPNLMTNANGEQELDDTAAALSSWLQQIVANEQTFREPGQDAPPEAVQSSNIAPIIEFPPAATEDRDKTKPLPPLVMPPKPPSRTDSAIASELFSGLNVEEHHEEERTSKRRQTGSLHELLGKLIEEQNPLSEPAPKRKSALLDKLIDEPPAEPPAPKPEIVPEPVAEVVPELEPAVAQDVVQGEEPPVEEPPVATLALHLTQLTVGTTAEATLITRANEVIASAGQIPQRTLSTVLDTINAAWQDAEDPTSAIVRYLHVTGAGDYLLYSTPTAEGMALSMLFPAETPLKVIRRHAKELIAALDHVPQTSTAATTATADGQTESTDSDEPEPARTLISRPTDLRPPDGLHEAIAAQTSTERAVEQAAPEPAAPRAEGPYAGYSFVWLPRIEALPAEIAGVLLDWIHAVATQHQWELEGVEIQPGYVVVQVSIPANETPSATVETLLHDTAERAGDSALWADAYYIVSPSRAVTQQEIASFVEYHQDAQQDAQTV